MRSWKRETARSVERWDIPARYEVANPANLSMNQNAAKAPIA